MRSLLRPGMFLAALMLLSSQMLIAGGDVILHHSAGSSDPAPFENSVDWLRTAPAISTGYYFLSSESSITEPQPPRASELRRSLAEDQARWRKIVSGPRQFTAAYWAQNPEGHAYFRNPAKISDSTDNAFAGPITIGFEFEFNGVRYDSIYVSSNGLIALSNRRYHYDTEGERIVPAGKSVAWDAQSDDPRDRSDQDFSTGQGDKTPDDWGFRYLACGGDINNQFGGIRSPNNSALDESSIVAAGLVKEAAIIAPFWDDWQLPQYDPVKQEVSDIGQAWYKRDFDKQELVIKFVNLTPIGKKRRLNPNLPDLEYGLNETIGPDAAFAINATVILNGADNTVSVLYEDIVPASSNASKGGVSPYETIRYNSTVGLRGTAPYTDSDGETVRYQQHTEFLRDGDVFTERESNQEQQVPTGSFALQFKQHKNLLRVVDVDYLVPNRINGEFTQRIKDVEDFELLAGHVHLGAVKAVVTYQNLSNDIQGDDGVNYQVQDLNFQAHLEIRHGLELPNTSLFKDSVCVDSTSLANSGQSGVRLVNAAGKALDFTGNGVPSYGFVEVEFAVFKPEVSLDDHIGRLELIAQASRAACNAEPLGEEWLSDNIQQHMLHSLKVLDAFYENASDFDYTRSQGPIPSTKRWVNQGAEVVHGSANTYHPLPPRERVEPENDFTLTLDSPVIRLNRLDLNGFDQAPGGDELRSFPIDLSGHESVVLSFGYQRAGIPFSNTYDRGWSDQSRVGPEARVVRHGQWDATEPLQKPDLLELHFANPSPDKFTNLVNIPADGWSRHPDISRPGQFITDNPVMTIFGGGGHIRGFHEDNADSALTRSQGLRYDSLDTGKDFEFHKVFVNVPKYLLDASNDAAKHVRFKFAVKAQDDGSQYGGSQGPRDDADNFYIDNIDLQTLTEGPDIEVTAVGVLEHPYSMFPASQASNIPLQVTLSNNSDFPSRAFATILLISERGAADNLTVYARGQTLPFLRAKTQSLKLFPVWNSRQTRPGRYVLRAQVRSIQDDPNPLNDSTHSFYDLRFDNAMAYDTPLLEGDNDVPAFSGQEGKGINLAADRSALFNSSIAYGADAGSAPGQLAIAFEFNRLDTVLGYQAYFGALNTSADRIQFAIHRDAGGEPAATPIAGSVMQRRRGLYDLDPQGNAAPTPPQVVLNTYGTYLLEEELELTAGDYWMVLQQLESKGFELGASAMSMGMQTTVYSAGGDAGVLGRSVMIDPDYRQVIRSGENVNRNAFMYNNSLSSTGWTQFTPTQGNPAYAHLTHAGSVALRNTYSRASWVPMMRPYMDFRTFSDPPQYTELPVPPVELSAFDGLALPHRGNELFWETASEIDNAGFYVERRQAEISDEFISIGFVNGAGTTNEPQKYTLLDADVFAGKTYEYRLRQVDLDGTTEFSHTVTLRYDAQYDVRVNNVPNPFTRLTELTFDVPFTAHVRIEMFDVFGNLVRTLQDGSINAGVNQVRTWDTLDDAGNACASGMYICRLNIGGNVKSHVLHLLR